MKRLKDNLNSQYIEAANRLKPNNARRRIVAYVESYDDVLFWRTVLDEFETDRLYFEVMLPSRTSLGKGKKNVLTNELGKGLGEYMIACVDADYDYLMQGCNETSQQIISNPYIFHTYVYAIENYQCYAEGLHEACVMATLNDHQIVDLVAFMQEYSKIIWPLFVWSVWCYRNNCYHNFTLLDFCNVVSVHNVSISHPERTLDYVRRQVNRYIATLQQRHPEGKETYAPLRQELRQLGLEPEATYLYIQGHKLFDSVVLPLLEPVCDALRKEREAEIRQYACHETQRQNELSCYRHGQMPIDTMLKKNTSFKRSEPFQRLRADIQGFLNTLH